MTDRMNKQVLLASRPRGDLREDNFSIRHQPVPSLEAGQFLIQNHYLSLDAGFRQWMNDGAGDNYLAAMPLDAPVMSITIGQVMESRNKDFPTGSWIMGRNAWESFSVCDGTDYVTIISPDPQIPLHYYVGTLGPTGFTAYFGLTDIGQPAPGETVVVSAAAGAVGSIVGQLAKAKGCRTIGLTRSTAKCKILTDDIGYDAAINYNDPQGLSAQLNKVCPDGVDIYFDNVGGEMLDQILPHMKQNGRVILCGAISQYNDVESSYGIRNLWHAVTKRLTLKGFMFSDHIDRYPEALAELGGHVKAGAVRSFVQLTTGIENTPKAYCDMLGGRNIGKAIVQLETEA